MGSCDLSDSLYLGEIFTHTHACFIKYVQAKVGKMVLASAKSGVLHSWCAGVWPAAGTLCKVLTIPASVDPVQ